MPTSVSQRRHKESSSRATVSSSSDGNIADYWSRQFIDLALMASVFVVPCVLGGRIAWGQLALAASAVVAASAWTAGLLFGKRPTWSVTWVEPLLLGVIGLGLLQITPLPPALEQAKLDAEELLGVGPEVFHQPLHLAGGSV